jgi:hypothetical protein
MHIKKEDLPLEMDWGGIKIFATGGLGDQDVNYMELSAGFDFGPLLEGLPNDMCPVPHWGFVTKGSIHFRYSDGTEEVVREGEVFYSPAGHTVWVEEDSAMLFFSPEQEHSELDDHFNSKMDEIR